MRSRARHGEVTRASFGRLLLSHIRQTEQTRFRTPTRIVVALLIGASFAFLRAIRTQGDRWLWLAVLFASLAVGIRVTGLAIPAAMLL